MTKSLSKIKVRFPKAGLEFVGEGRTYLVIPQSVTAREVVLLYENEEYVYRTHPRDGYPYRAIGTGRYLTDELDAMLFAYASLQMLACLNGYHRNQERRKAAEIHEAERQMSGGLPAPLRAPKIPAAKRVPVHPAQKRLL